MKKRLTGLMTVIGGLLAPLSVAADAMVENVNTGVQSKWWIGAVVLVAAAITLVFLFGKKKDDQ